MKEKNEKDFFFNIVFVIYSITDDMVEKKKNPQDIYTAFSKKFIFNLNISDTAHSVNQPFVFMNMVPTTDNGQKQDKVILAQKLKATQTKYCKQALQQTLLKYFITNKVCISKSNYFLIFT